MASSKRKSASRSKAKKVVAFGLLGVNLDRARGKERWGKWRPTLSLVQQDDLEIDRLEFIYQERFKTLASQVKRDIRSVSPHTLVQDHILEFEDPWDFEGVYNTLANFVQNYAFDESKERYLAHVTTGTHVAQICTFLLVESRFIPGVLVQTSPARDPRGTVSVIDLDLSKYDRLSSRFSKAKSDDVSFLKSGIQTKSPVFNRMIDEIENVAQLSRAPMLLRGETGVGKTQLAKKIYALKKKRHQVSGPFVVVNCATLRGDNAMSALFGHVKGAFTGAEKSREGLLMQAEGGVLFLDEIGELGLKEQAMLLRALEEKSFLPVGADVERSSSFQLISGTNRRLRGNEKLFREDLLARIDLWSYEMPPLRERREDIEPNLDYELALCSEELGHRVVLNKEARSAFLRFAKSAPWPGNFRDFHGSMIRLATLSAGEKITSAMVKRELVRLQSLWSPVENSQSLEALLGDRAKDVDRFDREQLLDVVRVCQSTKNMSEAGRVLFSESRKKRSTTNDGDRLRKYLAKFGLEYAAL